LTSYLADALTLEASVLSSQFSVLSENLLSFPRADNWELTVTHCPQGLKP